MSEVKWQCSHCRLPKHPEGTRVTHGLHDTCCLVLYGRETYIKLVEKREARDEK